MDNLLVTNALLLVLVVERIFRYFVRTKKVRKCACFITGLLYNIGKHKEV